MSGEVRLLSENGTMIYTKWKVRALQKGQQTTWLFVAHDITSEKQKELDLLRFSNVIQRTDQSDSNYRRKRKHGICKSGI